MAEGLFREMVKGMEGMEVSSAGVAAGDGERPSGDAVAAMGQLGIAIGKGRSRLLTEEILEEATDVFVMTRGHLEVVTRYFPWAAEKTFLLREFEVEEGGDGGEAGWLGEAGSDEDSKIIVPTWEGEVGEGNAGAGVPASVDGVQDVPRASHVPDGEEVARLMAEEGGGVVLVGEVGDGGVGGEGVSPRVPGGRLG